MLDDRQVHAASCFSALQRAEIAEIHATVVAGQTLVNEVSVLFNEPKLLKFRVGGTLGEHPHRVSVLFNEPKLLKLELAAEIAARLREGFSALQRAEIAEMRAGRPARACADAVSVLFNEPKLLKSTRAPNRAKRLMSFSALQRAEIAEIFSCCCRCSTLCLFQCSSTSRNC